MPRWLPAGDEVVFWQSQGQLTSFVGSCKPSSRVCLAVARPAHEFCLAVASCGLLPRATCPGPRVRTAVVSLLFLPLRETLGTTAWPASKGSRSSIGCLPRLAPAEAG